MNAIDVTDIKLIEQYIALRDFVALKKKAYTEITKPYLAGMETIEKAILARLIERGANNTKTDAGTAFKVEHLTVKVTDRQAFLDYVKDDDAMLLAAAQKDAVREYIDKHNAPPPGVEIYLFHRYQCEEVMTQLPAHLQNRKSQAVSTEIIAGLGSPQPPHVSIQGGRFTLVDSAGNKKPVDTLYLDCIVIDGKKGRSRVFWGVGAVFEGEQSGPPKCFSDNDIGPSSLSQDPQSQTCATCVMARWDSDVSKMTGKPVPACKTMKKLALMLPGFNFPFQLRVPVMSHSSLQAYSSQFSTGEFDVSDVVTRVSFVEGKTGELEFNFADFGNEDLPFIDEPTMKLRDQMLAEKKTDVLVGRNDVPWQGASARKTKTTTD